MADIAFLKKVEKELADKGILIEAGFIGYRAAVGLHDAPAHQLEELKRAWMASAMHLFSSIMSILDPGDEPTLDDMKRLDLIDAELHNYMVDFCKRNNLPPPAPRPRH